MSKNSIRLVAATHVGLVRTNNEDNFVVSPDLSRDDWFIPEDVSKAIDLGEQGCLLVVADGMGGMNAGEVASAIAIETVQQEFRSNDLKAITHSSKSIESFMKSVVMKADEVMKSRVKQEPSTKGMGTTLIMVWVVSSSAHLVWCGDSRAYLFNPAFGLTRISKDHSYVQQLVDAGKLDEDLAFDHPDSNIITRCLGDFSEKAKPDYRQYQLRTGDIVMLCSDGLCAYCRDEEILSVINQFHSALSECIRQLVQHALDAGGYDNVTVAMLQIVETETEIDEKNATAQSNGTLTFLRHHHLIAFCLVILALLLVGGILLYWKNSDIHRIAKPFVEVIINHFN